MPSDFLSETPTSSLLINFSSRNLLISAAVFKLFIGDISNPLFAIHISEGFHLSSSVNLDSFNATKFVLTLLYAFFISISSNPLPR